MGQTIPRWLIDDTSDLGNARIFCVHTQTPRLIGELVPEDEAHLEGIQISGLPDGQVLTRIRWMDNPVFDPEDLAGSLARAIDAHGSVRWQK